MNRRVKSQKLEYMIEMSDKRIPPPPALPPNIKLSENYCLFHKGEIVGNTYTCPKCKIKYCMKCALEAKTQGTSCIKCKQIILI